MVLVQGRRSVGLVARTIFVEVMFPVRYWAHVKSSENIVALLPWGDSFAQKKAQKNSKHFLLCTYFKHVNTREGHSSFLFSRLSTTGYQYEYRTGMYDTFPQS